MSSFFFFFQAEDGIRDAQESRGLGDVYKRQVSTQSTGKPSSLAMSFDRYEDEYRSTLQTLTTEVQSCKNKRGDDKTRALKSCDNLVGELREMQHDLDIAAYDLSGAEKSKAMQRIEGYKQELLRLTGEMKSQRNAATNEENRSLFSEDLENPQSEEQMLVFDKQRAKLHSGTHQLRTALGEIRDTEEVGLGIMEQLAKDRETIQRVDGNVSRSDESLSRSSGILRRMRNMDLRARIITVVLGLILFICVIVFLLVIAGVIQ
eukprot:TRINITY_DN29799_c0_g1_i1.p1 TRINITY_DN29799_c0_g1~~TRINITY_DN29799_c0_g1_i1.p1  ORF type:complete len:262 (-),score=76.55 TRINITY_DN29799_c0_g1_i1:514-1299(-)